MRIILQMGYVMLQLVVVLVVVYLVPINTSPGTIAAILINHPNLSNCVAVCSVVDLVSQSKLQDTEFKIINEFPCQCAETIYLKALHDEKTFLSIFHWQLLDYVLEPLYQENINNSSPFTTSLNMFRRFDFLFSFSFDLKGDGAVVEITNRFEAITRTIGNMIKLIPLHQRPVWIPYGVAVFAENETPQLIDELVTALAACLSEGDCDSQQRDLSLTSKNRLIGLSQPSSSSLKRNYSQSTTFAATRTEQSVQVDHNIILELLSTCPKMPTEDHIVIKNIGKCSAHRSRCESEADRSMVTVISKHLSESMALLPSSSSRLLCMTFTMSENHARIASIAGTWATSCDGYIAFSNVSDESLGIVRPDMPPYLQYTPEESYNDMWAKSQSIWNYVEESGLLDEYDYFLLGGDDLFVIPENLKWFLRSPLVQLYLQEASDYYEMNPPPMYLGRPINANQFRSFISGGSGYVLNRVAVRILNNALRRENDLSCVREIRASMEDLLVGSCLLHAGLEPFPFPLENDVVSDENGMNWLSRLFHPVNISEAMHVHPEWYTRMIDKYYDGADCCSPLSISYQNIKNASDMLCLYYMIKNEGR